MSIWTVLLLALGVSADAFAVALGKGLSLRGHVLRGALVLSTAFGVAQAVMPLLGWLLGTAFAEVIAPFDHWIAFALLLVVGVKMVWEAFAPAEDDAVASTEGFHAREVVVLAVATSIDALAVGVSLTFFDVHILAAVGVIGVVTFLLAFAAVFVGHRIDTRFRTAAEVIGGVVLIGIGTGILWEHLAA